jgi:hypothetical protein
MNAEEFVSLFRNCGLRINTIGNHFFNQQGLINYSFPTLAKISIKYSLIKSIRWEYLISVILTELQRKNTYEFILNTSDYNIEQFAKKTRNRIRKSLQNCEFKRPDFKDLISFGLTINQQTFKRQHKKDPLFTNPIKWNKYISSLYFHENVFILGAYYAGRMVGYIIVTELEERFIICHAYIDRIDSEITDPMNGLIYSMVNQLVEKNKSVNISYGIDSFTELPELNRFKSNMLFDKVPVSRVYILNPLLLPFVKLVIFYNLHFLKRRSIKNAFTRNMIRLYQGHRLFFRDSISCSREQNE